MGSLFDERWAAEYSGTDLAPSSSTNLVLPARCNPLGSLFDEHEAELLLSGVPEIDPVDWEAHTEYVQY